MVVTALHKLFQYLFLKIQTSQFPVIHSKKLSNYFSFCVMKHYVEKQ